MAALASTPAKGKSKKQRSRVHIDMTPMVDLAFLLLTFFVMTSTLMKPFTMELAMPDTAETGRPPIPDRQVLNLVLDENDVIRWYMGMPGSENHKTDFSDTGLRKLLLTQNRQIEKMYVLIKPSDKSRYKNMIDILDELSITGITRYSIVDVEPEDKNMLALH